MTRAALLTLLLAAGPLAAAPPDVPPAVPARVGEVVQFDVKGKGVKYKATFKPSDAFFARLATEDPDVMSFMLQVKPTAEEQPGGTRRTNAPLAIVFWNAADDLSATVEIDVAKLTPVIKKDEQKKDTPPPPVVVGPAKLQAIFVEETEEKSSLRSQFVGSADVRARFAAKGHPAPIIVDQGVKDGATNQPPAKLAKYLSRAKGKALPQLFLVDTASGKVTYEGPVPASVADFLTVLEKAGG